MRLKIIPWIMLFIAVTMMAFTIALYQFYKNSLINEAELRLVSYADNIIVNIVKEPDQFIKDPGQYLFSSSQNEFTSSGVLVQFMDNRGNLLAKAPALKEEELAFFNNEDDILQDVEMEDGAKFKIYQRKIDLHGTNIGYVIVGIPVSSLYSSIDTLRNLLIIVIIGVILILGFGISTLINLSLLKTQKLFLGFASHELRTPLSVIAGNAEVALRGKGSEKDYAETLNIIKQEADEMNDTVSNLLMMLRSQGGMQTLNKTDFSFSELLTEVISSLKRKYTSKSFLLRLPENDRIRADRELIKILIRNLLENAARNTDEKGKIRIELEFTRGAFCLKFIDNGTGIKKEFQPKIFDPYFQVEKGKNGGFGLGLAMASWIVHAHGGQISLDSVPGSGSTFAINLPQ